MLNNKFVYLIKIRNIDGSITWMGKENVITDPWSYQLFDFAKKSGFASKDEAILYPISFWREGGTIGAEIVKLEVW